MVIRPDSEAWRSHTPDSLNFCLLPPVRAKDSGEQLLIFITGYFPNASLLLRPYFAPTTPDS
ncbi:MAG: hypothetical protein ACKO2Z_34015 [Sphaerospermopsis kisseleviana]